MSPRDHLYRAEALLAEAESEAEGSPFRSQVTAGLAQAHAMVAGLLLVVAVVEGRDQP